MPDQFGEEEIVGFDRDDAQLLLDLAREIRQSGFMKRLREMLGGAPHLPETPIYVQNVGAEIVPPHGCMQCINTLRQDDRTYIQVRKPLDDRGLNGWYLFNGPEAIGITAQTRFGVGYDGPHVRTLGATDRPAGTRFRPIVNEWHVREDPSGFLVHIGRDNYRTSPDNINRSFIGSTAQEATMFVGELKTCLAKCDAAVDVIIPRPSSAIGTGGKTACTTGTYPNALMLLNGTVPCRELMAFFIDPTTGRDNGLQSVTVSMRNRRAKDGVKGSKVDFVRACNQGATQHEWQIFEPHDQIARRLTGGTWNDGQLTGYRADDGIDPKDVCGSIKWEKDFICPDVKKADAVYRPEVSSRTLHVYRVWITESAWMGQPKDLYYVPGNDSPGGGNCPISIACDDDNIMTMTVASAGMKGFPCGVKGAEPCSVAVPSTAVSVVTGVSQIGLCLVFTRAIIYSMCGSETSPNINICGIDCETGSSSVAEMLPPLPSPDVAMKALADLRRRRPRALIGE